MCLWGEARSSRRRLQIKAFFQSAIFKSHLTRALIRWEAILLPETPLSPSVWQNGNLPCISHVMMNDSVSLSDDTLQCRYYSSIYSGVSFLPFSSACFFDTSIPHPRRRRCLHSSLLRVCTQLEREREREAIRVLPASLVMESSVSREGLWRQLSHLSLHCVQIGT